MIGKLINKLAERRTARDDELFALALAEAEAAFGEADAHAAAEQAERLNALERRVAKLERTAVRKRPKRRRKREPNFNR